MDNIGKRFAVIFAVIAGSAFTAAGLYIALNSVDFYVAHKFHSERFEYFVLGVVLAVIGGAVLICAFNKNARRFLRPLIAVIGFGLVGLILTRVKSIKNKREAE